VSPHGWPFSFGGVLRFKVLGKEYQVGTATPMPVPSYGESSADSQSYYGQLTRDRKTSLTLAKCEAIAADPVVKFCLEFSVIPVRHMGWTVEGDDQEQVDFLTEALDGVLPDYLSKAANARKFGFAAFEIRYKPLADGRVGWNTFKYLDPLPGQRVTILENRIGRFVGLRYQSGTLLPVTLSALAGKCLLLTNRTRETHDRYGISELNEVLAPWEDWRFVNDMMLRWIEVSSRPVKKGYYRAALLKTTKPAEEVKDMLDSLMRGANVAIAMGPNGEKAVEIENDEVSDRMPLFEKALQFKDVQKMRALLVPERALTQDTSTGSYGMSQTHAGFFVQSQAEIGEMMLDALNDYAVPKLLAFNFPIPDASIRVVSEGFEDDDLDLQRDVIGKILGTNYLTPDVAQWLKDRTGIPIESQKIEPPAPIVVNNPNPAPVVPEVKPVVTAHDHAQKRPRTFAEFSAMTFSAREELLPGGAAKWFSDLAGEWEDIESRLRVTLAEIFATQRDQLTAAVTKALALPEQQALAALRTIGTRQFGAMRDAIEAAYREGAELGAGVTFPQFGTKFGGLTGSTVSYAKNQAEMLTDRFLTSLRLDVIGSATERVYRGLNADKILFDLKDVFDSAERSIERELVSTLGPAVNHGAKEILTVELDDPIVSVTRSERMEGTPTQCEVCGRFDGMTMDIDDPDLGTFMAPAGCMGGANCWGVNVFNQESMREKLREPDYKPLPRSVQDKVWYTEKHRHE
jgi:hypothetical protein